MSETTAILTINDKDYAVIDREGRCGMLVTAKVCNALCNSTDPWFSVIVGGFSFLGEGSGPFAQGDDKDPEPRAEVTGELELAGQFPTLEEAEIAGEAAISGKGYHGVFGDNYVIPEVANMRFIEG